MTSEELYLRKELDFIATINIQEAELQEESGVIQGDK